MLSKRGSGHPRQPGPGEACPDSSGSPACRRHILASPMFSVRFRLRSFASADEEVENHASAPIRRGGGRLPPARIRHILRTALPSVTFRLRSSTFDGFAGQEAAVGFRPPMLDGVVTDNVTAARPQASGDLPAWARLPASKASVLFGGLRIDMADSSLRLPAVGP